MRKLKFIVCLVSLLFISSYTESQNRDRNNTRNGPGAGDREELMAKRNTFLANRMGLKAEETAVFIPLENELQRKKIEVGRDCFRYERELNMKKDKTDEDFKRLLRCREEVREKREKLDKEYTEKFKKVLSAEKILKYQNADREFFNNQFIR